VPRGWDEWYGKTSQYNERSPGYRIYYDYDLYEKPRPGATPKLVHYGARPRAYQTDVLRRKAVDAIRRVGGPGASPFYMAVNFSAPHAPFVPAPRHRGSYRGAKLPKLDGFNERDISDKPRFLRRQARTLIPESQLRLTRRARRLRLEQLRSVDQAIAAIVRTLRRQGLLRNTYLVFTSDNGAFWGEHRISEGKYLPYDPAARVPLLIRGPGVPRGRVSRELVSNIDFAPTVLQLAGASAPPKFAIDGRSLVPFLRHPRRRSARPILLEGEQGPSLSPLSTLEQEPAARMATPTVTKAPAYRAVRTSRYLFVRYASGDVELYDMKRDPQQLRSRHRSRRYRKVRRRLGRLLARLTSCRGATCRT
jgi:arylsulfatase A-like enzyme